MKRLIILLILSLIIITYNITVLILFNTRYYEYDYCKYTYNENVYYSLEKEYYSITCEKLDKTYCKQLICEDIDNNFYLLIDFINMNRLGMTQPISRTIFVDSNCSTEEYILALTHEMLHLKYLTGNETFVNFQTFKYLYEHENLFFKKIGIRFAIEILMCGYEGNVYDCSYYIIEYFKEVKNEN